MSRPRHGTEVKSAPLSLRIDPALRSLLEERASASGKSLTQEVEALLRVGLAMPPKPDPLDARIRAIVRDELKFRDTLPLPSRDGGR